MDEELYNLLISGTEGAWESDSFIMDLSRFLEHTDKDLRDKYRNLSQDDIDELKKFPCIFAYESYCEQDAGIGYITDVIVRQGKIKITFRREWMLPSEKLHNLKFELDIIDWEFSRTHWAVKKVNLYKEMKSIDILIDPVKGRPPIDITKQFFDVAFTFAGETRSLVYSVVNELEKLIDKDKIFYDNNYRSQLARPGLDILLQDIYRNRSKLIVVFLCKKYQDKKWCGLEFKAIRELLMENDKADKIMYIRLDDGHVDGVFKTDGYVDGLQFTPRELAFFISERVRLLP